MHHPAEWIDNACSSWPSPIPELLIWLGSPLGDLTDAIGLTGHDAVYEYDVEAPSDSIVFAGLPRRMGPPAPNDIRVIKRGQFIIGWSPSLRHPVWVAYHVRQNSAYEIHKRPAFIQDRAVSGSPKAEDYTGSGYDRGHMAPNHAIASRYGLKDQKETFLMSNITPQKPALNRGVWRIVEHRIADLWSARYGEIWVIVGCISENGKNGKTLPNTDIDIPDSFYQVIVAQDGMNVRALALLFSQDVDADAWPTRHLISIDELEAKTGFDFLPDLPEFIQTPLEAELPSRLWPIRLQDAMQLISARFLK